MIGIRLREPLLIVPGYNDDRDSSERTATWLNSVDPDMRIKIIGYRAHGVRVEATHIPDADPSMLAEILSVFTDQGFKNLTVV